LETIVVVGGSKSTASYLGQRGPELQVLFHDAHVKTRNRQRKLQKMVKNADRIIVMVDACSHQSMWGG
jgi:4-hydroxy-3-methylbut-2-enyl diphosphate reductase IspH